MADDGNVASFTGTFFDTGQSVMVCADHLVAFCISLAEDATGVPIQAFIDDFYAAALQAEQAGGVVDAEDVSDDAGGASDSAPVVQCPSCGAPLELVEGEGGDVGFYGCAGEGLTYDLDDVALALAADSTSNSVDSTATVND